MGSRSVMVDDAAGTVLERKALAQRQALGRDVSVPRAFARSLAIAADTLWGLSATSVVAFHDTLSTDRALAKLDKDQLFLLIETGAGARGLVVLDRAIVTSLIEVQTLGKVTKLPLDSRRFTQTDAAMAVPLVDAALSRFTSMLESHAELEHRLGFAFAAMADDAETAGLAMEAAMCDFCELEVSVDQDTRKGRVVLCLPDPVPSHATPDGTASTGKHEAALKTIPARMHAVLTRIHIPLSKARSLKPGDVLDISATAVNSASLVANGGFAAARGKMGQMNGFRAIRIGRDDVSVPQTTQAVARDLEVSAAGAFDGAGSPEPITPSQGQQVENIAGEVSTALGDLPQQMVQIDELLPD